MTARQPVLFLGHGSPMNAIEDNAWSRAWAALGAELPRPKAVLMISAHWETRGASAVSASERPETIHDFGGFPQALFDVRYDAPGDPALAGGWPNSCRPIRWCSTRPGAWTTAPGACCGRCIPTPTCRWCS
jgi:aromatic ring-opening dioxygenase catalytic subunit (LigB family)